MDRNVLTNGPIDTHFLLFLSSPNVSVNIFSKYFNRNCLDIYFVSLSQDVEPRDSRHISAAIYLYQVTSDSLLCCLSHKFCIQHFFLLLIKIIPGYNYQFSHCASCILYQLYFNPSFLSSHLFMLLSLKILSYVEKEKWFLFPLTIYRISIINIKIFFLWLFHITPPFKRFVWKLIL